METNSVSKYCGKLSECSTARLNRHDHYNSLDLIFLKLNFGGCRKNYEPLEGCDQFKGYFKTV